MKKLTAFFLIIGIALTVGFIWWQRGVSPADPNNDVTKTFTIEQGEGLRAIANDLKAEGLIKDPVVFFLLVKQLGIDTKIQAGNFRLSPAMDAKTIAESLTTGTLDIWVTIPEGKRAEEIAEILEESMPLYEESWRETLLPHEGYLFPDTYLFPREATIETVVNVLTDTFDEKYATIDNPNGYSQEEIVTIASLIEREARHDVDRPLVSSVIHNRLGIGMKLDIDATVQYVLGYQPAQESWWKRGLTLADLQTPSPYNTYQNAGLPPTPIASPGIESLQAAASPESTDYLYYIADAEGVNRYGASLDEHNSNIATYGLHE